MLNNLKGKKNINIAIVGATGLVGNYFLKILEQRNFPVKNLKLFASKNSNGKILNFKNEKITVETLTENSFKDCNIALFSAGAEVSKKFSPIAEKNGCIVIDNSSAFRMQNNIPLIIPEINLHHLKNCKGGIIANPNCSTIQMLIALNPIRQLAGLKRIIVSTYQSISGAGAAAIKEMETQEKQLKNNEKNITIKKFPKQIYLNVIPQIDVFTENLFTKEELKMVNETHKIFADKNIDINITCVRTCVKRGHSESIYLETEKEINIELIKNAFEKTQGIIFFDENSIEKYPTPIDSEDNDYVMIGRLRKDLSIKKGYNLWVVSDNIRKGAATNAVQIAECLIK